jgi:hypothetical protein
MDWFWPCWIPRWLFTKAHTWDMVESEHRLSEFKLQFNHFPIFLYVWFFFLTLLH